MRESLKAGFSRVLWSFCLGSIVMVFALVAMLTRYHGTADMKVLLYGVAVAVGFALVIIFGRLGLLLALVGGLVAALVFNVSVGMLVATGVAVAVAFIMRGRKKKARH
jgi:hypothetical protein